MAVLVWVNNRPPGPVEWRPKRLEVGVDNFSLVRAKMTRYVDMLRVRQLSVGTCISTRVLFYSFANSCLCLNTKDFPFSIQIIISLFYSSKWPLRIQSFDKCEQNCLLKQIRYSLSLLPQSVQKFISWVGTELLYFFVLYLLRAILVRCQYLATRDGEWRTKRLKDELT